MGQVLAQLVHKAHSFHFKKEVDSICFCTLASAGPSGLAQPWETSLASAAPWWLFLCVLINRRVTRIVAFPGLACNWSPESESLVTHKMSPSRSLEAEGI